MRAEDQMVIMEVRNLVKQFKVKQGFGKPSLMVYAINDISFSLRANETYGLVGESGCGKSTTGRAILRLIEPTSGEVLYCGDNLLKLDKEMMRMKRRYMQMIFQDPYASLNPRKTVGEIIEEPLKIYYPLLTKKQRMEQTLDILNKVGVRQDQYYRYPHEFSGGQRQRIGLARALVLKPNIIVCDEPVSALDVSIQSQVLNLLRDIQQEMALTYLFISHNMSVVRYISDRVGVMYMGHIVEEADTNTLFEFPAHPYTQALLSAVPEIDVDSDKNRIQLPGSVPSPLHPPTGCAFHNRCEYCMERCRQEAPQQTEIAKGHLVKCHRYAE